MPSAAACMRTSSWSEPGPTSARRSSGCRGASSASVRSAVPARTRAAPLVTHTMSCVSMSTPRLVARRRRDAVVPSRRRRRAARRTPAEAFGVRARGPLGGEQQPRRRERLASVVARPRMAIEPRRDAADDRAALGQAHRRLATSCSRSVCTNTTSTNCSRSTLRSRHASPATEPPRRQRHHLDPLARERCSARACRRSRRP